MAFDKEPLTTVQMVERLINHGMVIEDQAGAVRRKIEGVASPCYSKARTFNTETTGINSHYQIWAIRAYGISNIPRI